jgi:hypothetical protein
MWYDKDRPMNDCLMHWSMVGEEQGISMTRVYLNGRTCYKNDEATIEYSNLYPGNKQQCHIWLLGRPWWWMQQTPPKLGTHPTSRQGILSQKTGVFIQTKGCISSHMTTHLQCLEFQNAYSHILWSYYRSMTKFTDLVTICQQDLHICTPYVTSQIQPQHINRNKVCSSKHMRFFWWLLEWIYLKG